MATGTYQTPKFTHTSGWQLGKSINECMLELFHTKLWSDVSFVCTDQDRNNLDDRVPAHKMLLAARSPVFQAMFYGPCACTTAEIQLDDIEAEDLKLFLTYLYSDSMDLTSADAASSVMQIAHKYQVTSLFKYCSNYLASIINTENVCDILQLALFYGEKNLTETVINYIDDHAEQFIETDAFLHLAPSSLLLVLKGNTLFAPESKIFHAVINWAKSKCEMEGVVTVSGQAIRKVLGEMFYQLRTPTMGALEFSECTFMQGYYSLEEHETILALITGHGSNLSLTCNSLVPRLPRIETATIEIPTNSNDTKAISSDISLIVSKDIIRSGFRISSMRARCSSYRSFYSNTGEDIFALAYKGSVTIEGKVEFQFETKVGQDPEEFVMFTSPVFVEKSDTEYVIKLRMKCITASTVDVPCFSGVKKFKSPSEHVEFVYKNSTNTGYHVAISAFMYQNMSKR